MTRYISLCLVAVATLLFSSCGSGPVSTTTETAESTPSLEIEKPQLTFGFIKLTDMAPLWLRARA